jgi:hypothetical protein
MKVDGILRISVGAMALALLIMLLCLAWPTPRTIAVFLGPGLALGMLGIVTFGVRVIRDLRHRRLL